MTVDARWARSPARDWRPSPRLAPGERRSARNRILAAASELFYREGVRSVGVDRIVEHAEVAKATFYRHFPSKDELVAAWLSQPHVRFLDWIGPEAERRSSTPAEAVIEYFRVLGEWFTNDSYRGCPFINSAAEFADPDHPAPRALTAMQGGIVLWFDAKLEAAGKTHHRELAEQLILVAGGAMVRATTGDADRAGQRAVAAAEALIASMP